MASLPYLTDQPFYVPTYTKAVFHPLDDWADGTNVFVPESESHEVDTWSSYENQQPVLQRTLTSYTLSSDPWQTVYPLTTVIKDGKLHQALKMPGGCPTVPSVSYASDWCRMTKQNTDMLTSLSQ